jgi:hypothetical protein
MKRIELVEALMVAVQRAALQLPLRRVAQDGFKKRTISRAEGGQLQALVGRGALERSVFVIIDLMLQREITPRVNCCLVVTEV